MSTAKRSPRRGRKAANPRKRIATPDTTTDGEVDEDEDQDNVDVKPATKWAAFLASASDEEYTIPEEWLSKQYLLKSE